MTKSPSDADRPTIDDEFQRMLTELVRTAAANGVDVRGGWALGGELDEQPAWDIEIVDVDSDASTPERGDTTERSAEK